MATPTLVVLYGEKVVKVRIDAGVPLGEVVRQLCASTQLAVEGSPLHFALREKTTGVLATEESFPALLVAGNGFRLVPSPAVEAMEMVENLNATGNRKLATFSLRTLLKEQEFADQFLAQNGFAVLQQVILQESGNILAYSLNSFLALASTVQERIDPLLLPRLVQIIATQPMVNVVRPAMAILARITLNSLDVPASTPKSPASPASTKSATGPAFLTIYQHVQDEAAFIGALVEQLNAPDVETRSFSLALINALFQGSIESGQDFAGELEVHGAWETLHARIASPQSVDSPALLTFQTHLVASFHQTLSTKLRPEYYPLFDSIWTASELDDIDERNRWRRLGFKSEGPQVEFEEVGLLGLKALANVADVHQPDFAKMIKDQLDRTPDVRCPIAQASRVVTQELVDIYDFSIPNLPPVRPQPVLFRFYQLHYLILVLFLRVWVESRATTGEFEKVSQLVRKACRESLSSGEKDWATIEHELSTAGFESIKQGMSNGINGRYPPQLHGEALAFVRRQRINSLIEGAWFLAPPTPSSAPASFGTFRKSVSHPPRQSSWRFYRLDVNERHLHYLSSDFPYVVAEGLEDMTSSIDLKTCTTILPHASGAGPSSKSLRTSFSNLSTNTLLSRNASRRKQSTTTLDPSASSGEPLSPSTTNNTAHNAQSPTTSTRNGGSGSAGNFSFSLYTDDLLLVELTAIDQTSYSTFFDGLGFLVAASSVSSKEGGKANGGESGTKLTKETEDMVHQLMNFGRKLLESGGSSL